MYSTELSKLIIEDALENKFQHWLVLHAFTVNMRPKTVCYEKMNDHKKEVEERMIVSY